MPGEPEEKEARTGAHSRAERRGRMWNPVARIKLPQHVKFKDYAGMALRGDRLAVVSQESSRLWVGRLRPATWTIAGRGRIYDFPTNKERQEAATARWKGSRGSRRTTLVAVSDLRKKRHPKRCAKTDQSIHVFRIP